MIRIKSQDGLHQYDESGRSITTWDDKKCSWIVNPEFENEEIDWWGNNNDFPAGCTLKRFEQDNPNWNKIPNISVTWTWDTKEDYERMGGPPHSFGQSFDYYDKLNYPQRCTRSWGYIECSKEDAVKRFANYANFHRFANKIEVYYNNELLFSGKYKEENQIQ